MSVNKVNSDGSLSRIAGSTLFADTPVGTISPFGGSAIPSGYLLCNGAEVLKTTYAELYAVIGDVFGTASDNTKFKLPDLRGEFLRGAGTNSHNGQGAGGSVGCHQDATGIDSFITEQITHRLVVGYGAQQRGSTINADASTRSGLTGSVYQKTDQSVTDVYLERCFVRPTNTSVNYIIKAKHTPIPADFMNAVDEAVEEVYSDIIPSNAGSANKLVTRNDVVIRHNYSVTGTTDAIADTKALINHIVTSLDVGTYAGEFKRSGITFGSYRLTYFIDGVYTKSVSGIVTYSINISTDATYQVSYTEDIEHGTPPVWKIEKLTSEEIITLTPMNNSTIIYNNSRIIGGLVTVCASITVPSGNYLVKENAVANVPNLGTASIGYILPCLYRNTGSGAEEPGYIMVQTDGNLYPYYTKTGYNEIRINASYSSKA